MQNREAILPHRPKNGDEISMNIGDTIEARNENINVVSAEGTNLRTKQRGLFPPFKVIEKIKTAKLPTYSNVPT